MLVCTVLEQFIEVINENKPDEMMYRKKCQAICADQFL